MEPDTTLDDIIGPDQVAVVLTISDNKTVNFQVVVAKEEPEDEEVKKAMEIVYLAATGIVASISQPGKMTEAVNMGRKVLVAAKDLQEYGEDGTNTGD